MKNNMHDHQPITVSPDSNNVTQIGLASQRRKQIQIQSLKMSDIGETL